MQNVSAHLKKSLRPTVFTTVAVLCLVMIRGSSQPSPNWVGADPESRSCVVSADWNLTLKEGLKQEDSSEDLSDLKLDLAQAEEQGAERVEHARELLGDDYENSTAFSVDSVNRVREPLLLIVKNALRQNRGRKLSAEEKISAAEEDAKLAQSMVDAFVREGERFHFDPVFLASVAMTESRFRVKVRGAAGEVGLLQLMPETARGIARQIGMDLGADVTTALENPETNIRLGAVYFQALRETFDARSEHYLSAYNMGAGKVRELLSNQAEPRAYYERVMGSYSELYKKIAENLRPDFNYDGVLSGVAVGEASVSQATPNPT